MPELPEVETVRRSLEPKIKNRVIRSVRILLPRLVKYPTPQIFQQSIQNLAIKAISRKGKYLLIELSDEKTLVIHLGMSGRLLLVDSHTTFPKHTHITLHLDNNQILCFIDPRTFGRIALLNTSDYSPLPGLYHLGIDPLSKAFSKSNIVTLFKSNRPIKAFLMDQSKIAGLGNIYVDECLFRAGIHPLKHVSQLKAEQIDLLCKTIPNVLTTAIRMKGTTVYTFVDDEEKSGKFQKFLKVYGKTGEPCVNCGSPVNKITLAGRSTHFCPVCQK